jgi:hypothetical protein
MRARRMGVMALAALVVTAIAVAASVEDRTHPMPDGAHVIADSSLTEMSGLVASAQHPGVLWGVNDSGSFDRLFRIGSEGQALGRVWIGGAWLRDAETLARWHDGSVHWLLVGDIGDNRAWRDSVVVHGLREPDASAGSVDIEWSLRFRYPDGPRDAEGMAIDPLRRELLVVSKRDRPPRLYRVSLYARDPDQPTQAQLVGTLGHKAVEGDVTGLDVSDDGLRLALLSYRGLYLWRREPAQDWSEVLSETPEQIEMPRMRKAEALAFTRSQDRLLVGSEQQPAPLWRSAQLGTGVATRMVGTQAGAQPIRAVQPISNEVMP